MRNPYNETLVILMLTLVIGMLFDVIIAKAAWSATIQRNPDNYMRFIQHITWLEGMRSILTGERIQWKHG